MSHYHLHLESQRARRSTCPSRKRCGPRRRSAIASSRRSCASRSAGTATSSTKRCKTADFMINSNPPRERLAQPRAAAEVDTDHRRRRRRDRFRSTGCPRTSRSPTTAARTAHKAEDSCALALLVLHTRMPERSWISSANACGSRSSRRRSPATTAVILGFGDLGQGAGRAAKKLGLRVIAVTRSGKADAPADEVLPVSRIDGVCRKPIS